MKSFRKFGALALSTLLLLGLTACGGEETPETPETPEASLPSDTELVTDGALLDGMWSIGDTTMLYIDSETGYYAFREEYTSRGGQGTLWEEDGKPMMAFNGFRYDFLLRDDGVLLPRQNGDSEDFSIDSYTFSRNDEVDFMVWDDSVWDGVWQNALGETIVIDTARGQYIAASPDYYFWGTAGNNNDGMGYYLDDEGERAYICAGSDGDSFRLLGVSTAGRFTDDGYWDGVFYRDGDIEAYTDFSQAEFIDPDGFMWYFDGVSKFGLRYFYELGDDGLAYYCDDGQIFPAGWIPEKPYDPAEDWGEDWMENWD